MSPRLAPQPADDQTARARRRGRPVVRVRPDAATGDRAYAAFGNAETRNGLQERIEIPLLIRSLGLPRGGRVLEVGCGRGIALPVLAERLAPWTLTGLDIDPHLVALAQKHVTAAGISATVVEGDLRFLPFAAGSFDLVIDFGTCYHVGGGARGASAALAEIARVLSVGGLFVHETPVAQHLAHPTRSFGRTLPWGDGRGFIRERTELLWSARRKLGVRIGAR